MKSRFLRILFFLALYAPALFMPLTAGDRYESYVGFWHKERPGVSMFEIRKNDGGYIYTEVTEGGYGVSLFDKILRAEGGELRFDDRFSAHKFILSKDGESVNFDGIDYLKIPADKADLIKRKVEVIGFMRRNNLRECFDLAREYDAETNRRMLDIQNRQSSETYKNKIRAEVNELMKKFKKRARKIPECYRQMFEG